MNYNDFIYSKTHEGCNQGFDPLWMPSTLYDFQSSLVNWSVVKGRSAILADCGLGKTAIQMTWAENVVRKTNKPVLVLTPLAVSTQTIREGEKFGIESKRSNDGSVAAKITITNYEKLHLFNWHDYIGVVCDESSILKSFTGKRRSEITDFMRKVPYRLLCTATAAPNDYIELGTSSEALGYLGNMDMLNRFFKNDSNNSAIGRKYGEVVKWRFKGYSEQSFWRWVTSWAIACRKPSDLGFNDTRFILPSLNEIEHLVETKTIRDGMLFDLPAMTMPEQREERRRTIVERCEHVATIVNNTGEPALVWCHLNDEGKILRKMIPDAIEVSGSDKDESKEEKLIGFADKKYRVLITKPKIGAWGLNFQHCNHVTFFPSHSYEQYYQGVRRCWRFGQKRPVNVDIVYTEGDRAVLDNLKRKSLAASVMFNNLVAEMNNSISINVNNKYLQQEKIPSWL